MGYGYRGTASTLCRIANTQQSSLIDQSRLYYISHMSPLYAVTVPAHSLVHKSIKSVESRDRLAPDALRTMRRHRHLSTIRPIYICALEMSAWNTVLDRDVRSTRAILEQKIELQVLENSKKYLL